MCYLYCKIKGSFRKKNPIQKCAERGSFLYIYSKYRCLSKLVTNSPYKRRAHLVQKLHQSSIKLSRTLSLFSPGLC